MLSCIWKFDLPVELNSAFSNYPTASPGITGMSNLSRSWPTKWKMAKAVRGKGVTRKLCKVLRVTWWHHQWIQTAIKATASTGEQQTHRGRKQVRGNLSLKMIGFVIGFKLITAILLASEFPWLSREQPLLKGEPWEAAYTRELAHGAEVPTCSTLTPPWSDFTSGLTTQQADGQHRLSCSRWRVMWETALRSLQGFQRPLENTQRKDLALLPAEVTPILPSAPSREETSPTPTFRMPASHVKIRRHHSPPHEFRKMFAFTFFFSNCNLLLQVKQISVLSAIRVNHKPGKSNDQETFPERITVP